MARRGFMLSSNDVIASHVLGKYDGVCGSSENEKNG